MSIVIGDIHGELKTLKKLLQRFPDEQIYLVGDLMDRGPDSVEVLQYVIDHPEKIHCVRGNHEQLMLDYYAGTGADGHWFRNGGKIVHEAYENKFGPRKLKEHLQFLEGLPYYLEVPGDVDSLGRTLIVSHSVIIDSDLQKCIDDKSILWGRVIPEKDPFEGKYFNVFGHTVFKEPLVGEWYAGIDTGCCYGKKLTAFQFPEHEILSMKQVISTLEIRPEPML